MRRLGIKIMGKLIVLAGPLLPFMLLAIMLGTLGQLCAITLTPLAVLCFLCRHRCSGGFSCCWGLRHCCGAFFITESSSAITTLRLSFWR